MALLSLLAKLGSTFLVNISIYDIPLNQGQAHLKLCSMAIILATSLTIENSLIDIATKEM